MKLMRWLSPLCLAIVLSGCCLTKPKSSQQKFIRTDHKLDLAIDGDGFFQIMLPNGTYAYTRNGAFSIGMSGEIVSFESLLTRSFAGIHIPSDATDFFIQSNGMIAIKTSGEGFYDIGQIFLCQFPNPAELKPLNESVFIATQAAGEKQFGLPDTKGFGALQQGYLELQFANNPLRTQNTPARFPQQRLYETDEPLDLAISGAGFFKIGLPDGSAAFTSSGSFIRSPTGALTTKSGLPVHSTAGIEFPKDSESITIRKNGEVFLKADGKQTLLGQIYLSRFINPGGLENLGGNMYRTTLFTGSEETGPPGVNGMGTVHQKYLEKDDFWRAIKSRMNRFTPPAEHFFTARSYDFAIEGTGFFQIELPDGTAAFTRDGAFRRNAKGKLITRKGYQVRSLNGLIVPKENSSLFVNPQGDVALHSKSGRLEFKTRLKLTHFENASKLKPVGNHLFIPTPEAGKSITEFPTRMGLGAIRQGLLEYFHTEDLQRTNPAIQHIPQKKLLHTGNRIDLAIEGGGYFAVQKPNGKRRYTRKGSFMIGPTGHVTTRDGWPALSFAHLRIPKNLTNFMVDHTGNVNATHGGKTEMIGQIKLYSPRDARVTGYDNFGMINVGNHLYTVWQETDRNPSIQKHPSPMIPHPGTFLHGWLENLGPPQRPMSGDEWAVED